MTCRASRLPTMRSSMRLWTNPRACRGNARAAFSGTAGVTESAAVEAALRQYLDCSSDATLLLRRLDCLGRAGSRPQRDLELLSAAFAVLTNLCFAHSALSPTTPNEPRAWRPRIDTGSSWTTSPSSSRGASGSWTTRAHAGEDAELAVPGAPSPAGPPTRSAHSRTGGFQMVAPGFGVLTATGSESLTITGVVTDHA